MLAHAFKQTPYFMGKVFAEVRSQPSILLLFIGAPQSRNCGALHRL